MNVNQLIQNTDIVFLTIDSLRYDVAQRAFEEKLIPNLSTYMPLEGWEKRYSPASFTFPAHQAFFAGFLPTKINQDVTPRLFAAEFLGSQSTTENTFVFKEDNWVKALENKGYLTVCIGGVGFFNMQTQISSVLPNYFMEKHWQQTFSVTAKDSAESQVKKALEFMKCAQPLLLFINFSATHQPNYFYLNHAESDSISSQKAALAYVDKQLSILFNHIKKRQRACLLIVCSDHGTAYGEDGHWGHRNGHDVVMTVPYFHKLIQ